MDIKLDCPLCKTHNLKVQGTSKQCQHCGMATDELYKNVDKTNDLYLAIMDNIKPFVKFLDNQMWVPSQVQFEFGDITPIVKDGKLIYRSTFRDDSLESEIFAETLGFVIEKFHGETT